LIREGVQLFDMGMVHEAMEKWRGVLAVAPGHRDAEAYLAMAVRDQEAAPPTSKPAATPPPPSEMSGRDFPKRTPQSHQPASAPLPLATPEPAAPVPAAPELMLDPPASEAPASATPPSALTTGSQKTRKGFNLPEALQRVSLGS
jgi:hypothetical protein